MNLSNRNLHQAVTRTLPLFEMMRMRAATAPRKHPVHGFAGGDPDSGLRWANTFTHSKRLLTPSDREVVTPNNDTLYTNTWLDLSEGPLVIHVPAMGERYWTLGFLDMWTNPFAYAGRRTTGNHAQRLFVHGPQWQGSVPEGMIEITAPGTDVWIIGRILVSPDETDLAEVACLQKQFSIVRASDGQPAARTFVAGMNGRKTDTPEAAQYKAVVDSAWTRNHSSGDDTIALPLWNKACQARLADFQQALADVCQELRDDTQSSDQGGGWSLPVTICTDWEEQFDLRARVARNMIGALGIEEAMYLVAEVDAQGNALDGQFCYELYFPPGRAPQVDAFWSLTMYRKTDCLLVDNPIDRYSIGDRTPGLRWDSEGGLRLTMRHSKPADDAVNWLPAPRESFYLTLRLYQPRQTHLECSFNYPALTRLEPQAINGI